MSVPPEAQQNLECGHGRGPCPHGGAFSNTKGENKLDLKLKEGGVALFTLALVCVIGILNFITA